MSEPMTPSQTPTTIGEDFPLQQERVRELLEQYHAIGPSGAFGAIMIKQVLSRAEHAIASGDIVAIVMSYKELQDCQ